MREGRRMNFLIVLLQQAEGEIEEKRAGRCRVAAGALPAWRNSRFQRWRDSRVKSEVWP